MIIKIVFTEHINNGHFVHECSYVDERRMETVDRVASYQAA